MADTEMVNLDDVTFESNLDQKSKEKAKKELNENNDRDRLIAVDTLRKWVKDQPWLKCPVGTEFLIRRLRVRKYAQLSAREALEHYWTTRTKYPAWFTSVDPCDPILVEILKAGTLTVSKKLDSDGCRLLVIRYDLMDLNKTKKVWGTDLVLKAVFMMYEWITTDENVQVNGIKIFSDYTGMTMAQALLFSEHQGTLMSYFQKALPMRLKGMFLYNEPQFFDVLYAMFSGFLSDKLKSRMHLMGKNMAKVYEKLEMSMFPDEYLPDDYEGERIGPCSKIVDEMIEDMQKPKFRNYMLKLTAPGVYGVDLDMRKKDSKNSVPEASFRKLSVD